MDAHVKIVLAYQLYQCRFDVCFKVYIAGKFNSSKSQIRQIGNYLDKAAFTGALGSYIYLRLCTIRQNALPRHAETGWGF